jgi:hypothetical protein
MKNHWLKKRERTRGWYEIATSYPSEPLERSFKEMIEENARLVKAMREMIGETKSFRAWAGIILGSELD